MNKKITSILSSYHIATKLNFYVYNQKKQVVDKFINPLANTIIPDDLLASLKEQSTELKILLISNKSSVAAFNYCDFTIICWNSNFTIESNGNYDRLSPLLGYDQFREVMKCLYHLIYHKFPTINSAKIETGANLLTKSSTLNTSSYEGYLSECEMLDALASGNINRFNYAFRVFVKNGNFGKFGQTKLRNEKDMAIVATTLYTRSAIKGGLSVTEAYSLSDEIIKQIEKDKIISNYYEYTRAIGEIFVNRINRQKRTNLTVVVYKAQEYIYAHYAKIKSVDEIANYLNISLPYLQHRFKKETGQSLIQFINQQKIAHAKHELLFTDKSINEIAQNIGCSNQSSFSSLFKKIETISPMQYRKQYK